LKARFTSKGIWLPGLNQKLFKAKLSQRLWFENILLIEKAELCFLSEM
jgi:hypothetical protein